MKIETVNTFCRSEDGGAAFDWKVLSALVVAAGVIVGGYAYDGSEGATDTLNATLEDESLPDQIFPGRSTD